MTEIHLNGHVDVPEDRLKTVLAALPEHIRLSRAEDGCIFFNVDQDAQNPLRLLVSEAFTDRPSFDAHQTRASSSHWAEVTEGLPRHYTITETS
ncbi:MAG: putative quinol monooxygenase [Halocynthiibacter sp.]